MRFPARAALWLVLAIALRVPPGVAAPGESLLHQLERIYSPTRVEQAALSHDGQHVAFAMRDERELKILVYPTVGEMRPSRLRVDAPTGAEFKYLAWVANDRLVAAIDSAVVLVLDVSGRVVLQLDDAKAYSPAGEQRSGRPSVFVLGPAAADADVVVMEVRWSAPGAETVLDLVRLNVRSLERTLAVSRRLDAGGAWLIDHQGRPRLWVSSNESRRRFQHWPVDGDRAKAVWLDRLDSGNSAAAWETTPRTVIGERIFPLGFAGNPDLLYFASNVGRDTYGIYALDVASGMRTTFAVEDTALDLADFMQPTGGGELMVDRATGNLVGIDMPFGRPETHWLDGDLEAMESSLEARFPHRAVRLLEWDDARQHFLAHVTAPTDNGRYFVFHRDDGRCVEYQRNPAPAAGEAPRVESFRWATAGETISGTVTWPLRIGDGDPAPALVVWLHDGPLQLATAGLHRESQALAAAGFAVAQCNYRGSVGHGRRRIELLRTAFDRVPIEDALALVASLAEEHRIDPQRVAIAGEGFGGFVALRAVQQLPEVFRAAVGINAPLHLAQLHQYERNLQAYQQGAEQRLRASGPGRAAAQAEFGSPSSDAELPSLENVPSAISGPGFEGGGDPSSFERAFARWFFGPADRQRIAVADELARLTQPVMFLHNPRLTNPAIGPVRQLRENLARRKQVVQLIELTPAFARGESDSRLNVARQIVDFISTHVAPKK